MRCWCAFSPIFAPSPAFRVLDTHAGAGLYDLAGPEASRSPEWREGIARLLAAPVAEPARALIAPYLDAVAGLNPAGRLVTYPGSPALMLALLRPQDRLIACELEPNAAAALARHLGRDRRSKAIALDGWTALNAYVPPKERRGLVLIDPPFEDEGDFPRLAQGLEAAHRKWPGGSYLLWYPIKERAAPDALARGCGAPGSPRFSAPRSALRITRLEPPRRLRSDRGQPPWTLASEPTRCCRRWRRSWRARAAATASIGSPAKAVSPLFHSLGLAYFRRAGFDVPPPVGAGGVTEALSSGRCLSRLRMSSRAAAPWGRRRGNHGEGSFPMAMAGVVKFFNAERGYGFIKPDDGGRDVFVHITAVERAGLKSLNEGQRISFDVEPDKKGKGPKAVNLVITG